MEQYIEVSQSTSKRLIDIMADNPTLVKIKDKEYEIRGLRTYSRIKIAEVYNKIVETEKSVENIILKSATNLRYSAEIIAIILLNHTFTADNKDNEVRIEQMTSRVMLETEDENEWSPIIIQAVNSLNIEAVFMITASAKVISTSLLMRKKRMEEQSQYIPAQK